MLAIMLGLLRDNCAMNQWIKVDIMCWLIHGHDKGNIWYKTSGLIRQCVLATLLSLFQAHLIIDQ